LGWRFSLILRLNPVGRSVRVIALIDALARPSARSLIS
jgi:hypothetical protein